MLKKIFGSRNDRLIKAKLKVVKRINALEPEIQALDDTALQAKTDEFKERLQQGETLEKILPEAFAVMREASRRVLGMRHYDVQLIGGMVLHHGKIAEMKTGEGKTLVATLAVYLNALTGMGVHVVTVNDYLARRDAEWMGRVYKFLGLTVGVIVPGLGYEERAEAYAADITYATNNELGFDYLRDNLVFNDHMRVQRGHAFAIVDEVDSILIDEARTPLIISGEGEDQTDIYLRLNAVIPRLKRQEPVDEKTEMEEEPDGDFTVDEKSKAVYLTDAGHQKVETFLVDKGILAADESLYDAKNIRLVHYVNALLRAHHLYQRNVDYLVQNNEVVIVDEFTGRTMPGRRWGDGLHQAVEAKEGVPIRSESQTLASITFQNYFRMYDKLAGMTGTADTEAYEFQQIYGLEVVVIPPNRPMARKDHADLVYLTLKEKYRAIIEDIRDCYQRQQPVLVGTASIESSELLSRELKKEKIPHKVLNAKQHAKEARVIADAGRPGAVTIATNMAGRGTDIVLGGNIDEEIAALKDPSPEKVESIREEWKARHAAVIESGGLHVIGTERHESRRVDNQLRGRSGRQGDPGSSRFYLSLEDNLMRIFASEKVSGMMKRLGMGEGEAIEHPWVTKAISNAQKKVEGHNFEIRKHLIEYDDVSNEQRKVIFEMRQNLMQKDDISDMVDEMWDDVYNAFIDRFVPPQSLYEQWDVEGLQAGLVSEFGLKLPIKEWLDQDEHMHEEVLREKIIGTSRERYHAKIKDIASREMMQHFEKQVVLRVLDTLWREHINIMEHLRESIYLRSYAQKNPKHEFQSEAFKLFRDLLARIHHESVSLLSKIELTIDQDGMSKGDAPPSMVARHDLPGAEEKDGTSEEQPYVRKHKKVGRNQPCPCGSGKKYKHCHGQLTVPVESES